MREPYDSRTSSGLFEPLKGTDQLDGYMVGKNPHIIGGKKLVEEGIRPITPLRAIRLKCVDCCAGSKGEVRKCVATSCSLWPLRMGSNPFMRMQ